MNTKAKVLGGILLGTGIGLAAGILMAPRSGKKTRKKIISKSREAANHLVDKANDQIAAAKEAYNKKLSRITKNGKSAVDNLSEAIHLE